MYNVIPHHYLRKYLITKTEQLAIYGHNFSHISEMSFTFIANLKNMTYDYYLKQRESMLEWKLFQKLVRYPGLINAFNLNHSHPLIRE